MGYHKRKIKRGVYGHFSKIEEEFDEILEAREQNNRVMELVELSDLLGAIEAYTLSCYNLDLDHLLTMTRATQAAFRDGTRTRRIDEV
jgi:hypothetical protein